MACGNARRKISDSAWLLARTSDGAQPLTAGQQGAKRSKGNDTEPSGMPADERTQNMRFCDA
jgi:hypothetical protein